MIEEKNFLPTFQIYSTNDLTKQWFVYYKDESGRWIRFKKGVNIHHTYKGRMKAAIALKNYLEQNYEYKEKVIISLRKTVLNHLFEMEPKWRKGTFQSHKANVNVFFSWLEENGFQANQQSVKAFFKHLYKTRHSTTYNVYVGCLKNIFSQIGHGQLTEGINRIPEIKTPARYYQAHHISKLCTEFAKRDPKLLLFVKFIFYCFIRPVEIRFMRVEDILFYEQKILIRGEISKNKKTQYVAIPDAFLKDLDFLKKAPPGSYLFPSVKSNKKPIGKNTMTARHRKILQHLGFSSDYKLYSWKHTGAVQLVKAGVSIKAIQTQMRHHSLDQTDQYLRQLGVGDFKELKQLFPSIDQIG